MEETEEQISETMPKQMAVESDTDMAATYQWEETDINMATLVTAVVAITLEAAVDADILVVAEHTVPEEAVPPMLQTTLP